MQFFVSPTHRGLQRHGVIQLMKGGAVGRTLQDNRYEINKAIGMFKAIHKHFIVTQSHTPKAKINKSKECLPKKSLCLGNQ
jgi:hypothetical protein